MNIKHTWIGLHSAICIVNTRHALENVGLAYYAFHFMNFLKFYLSYIFIKIKYTICVLLKNANTYRYNSHSRPHTMRKPSSFTNSQSAVAYCLRWPIGEEMVKTPTSNSDWLGKPAWDKIRIEIGKSWCWWVSSPFRRPNWWPSHKDCAHFHTGWFWDAQFEASKSTLVYKVWYFS